VTTLLTAAIVISIKFSGVQAAVMITAQPSDTVIPAGQPVVLAVVATSNRTMRYYWYKDGAMYGTKTKTISIGAPGNYSCMVSDGKSKDHCKPFIVTMSDSSRIKLEWDAPTTRMDGTALLPGQIAGYEVFMDGARVDYTMALTSEVKAAPGKHRFELRTIDTQGLSSPFSPALEIVAR
jgi:hypothetical protein